MGKDVILILKEIEKVIGRYGYLEYVVELT